MLQFILYYVRLIFTNTLIGLIIFSGIVLAFYFSHAIPKDKFAAEAKISKYGGYFYIISGIGILAVRYFLG